MINAVIFDMDGVISDTQTLTARVESELLAGCGVMMPPEEITRRYAGIRTAEFFKELLGGDHDVDSLIKEKRKRLAALAEKEMDPIPGAIELIDSLSENGFKLAVASASDMRYITIVLSKLGVIDRFQAITSSDEVERGKPDPAVFLLAAKRLSAEPSESLVIEDGISGMEAARSAGMKCVGLVPSKSGKDYPADILVTSLAELNPGMIRRL